MPPKRSLNLEIDTDKNKKRRRKFITLDTKQEVLCRIEPGIGASSQDLVDGTVAKQRDVLLSQCHINELLKFFCKLAYADNEAYQRKLYDSLSRVIFTRLNMSEVYEGGETDLSSRIQHYLETTFANAKVTVEGQKIISDIGGRINDSQRFNSNRGTIAATPSISVMARRNQLSTINAFDCGNHDRIVVTPSQDLMPPEEPRSSNLKLQSAVVRYNSKGQDDELNWSGDSNCTPIDSKEWCQKVLIIQMELCCGTLKEFLENRNKIIPQSSDIFTLVDEEKMLEILQSILKAVQYYHGKDVIHRDLKPSNIFFDKNGIVKVGDFGLATNKLLANECECGESSQRHTSNIGTKPYAAPEQMARSNYDYKVDMYSLGIIIIELFYPFNTEMEKSWIFTQFKEGNVPSKFQEKWPEQASLILSLLSKDSTKRPDAKDILSSALFKKITSGCNSKPLNIPRIITLSELKKRLQMLMQENTNLLQEKVNLLRENRELKMRTKKLLN